MTVTRCYEALRGVAGHYEALYADDAAWTVTLGGEVFGVNLSLSTLYYVLFSTAHLPF